MSVTQAPVASLSWQLFWVWWRFSAATGRGSNWLWSVFRSSTRQSVRRRSGMIRGF